VYAVKPSEPKGFGVVPQYGKAFRAEGPFGPLDKWHSKSVRSHY
jgi:hypothetical protein